MNTGLAGQLLWWAEGAGHWLGVWSWQACLLTGATLSDGKDSSWQYHYTRVWVRRGERWQAVTTALTGMK
jgi:hypothetical protein